MAHSTLPNMIDQPGYLQIIHTDKSLSLEGCCGRSQISRSLANVWKFARRNGQIRTDLYSNQMFGHDWSFEITHANGEGYESIIEYRERIFLHCNHYYCRQFWELTAWYPVIVYNAIKLVRVCCINESAWRIRRWVISIQKNIWCRIFERCFWELWIRDSLGK